MTTDLKQSEKSKATKVLKGTVSRCSSRQTIKVQTLVLQAHPIYRKVLKLTMTFTVHDAENRAKVGDIVTIRPCKPHSKTKSWELVEICE
ncbi:MAG: 30S ribosomal protein S17 [Gammaproteobacteria bacterium]|nr:30S ribosomal protein S17 [Gammaproteobacteria bacterium]